MAYEYSFLKLTHELLTMHGRKHQRSTAEELFLKQSKLSDPENSSPLVGLEPTTSRLYA